MNEIRVLDEQTIDKIAAGEVIERPSSVVKELVENAIDAGATAITAEIRDGGISFLRITDNGAGMEPSQIPTAFLRHATSKIRRVEDLMDISSLGFRGEALSSIAAVCQVELISKTPESLTGSRYLIEGGKEKAMEEIGAPAGTTFLVRNLFFNTPARKKFLKSPQTEAGYVSDMMERMALSHPEISFKFLTGSQIQLHTSGNHNLKDIIYNIYGRDIANNLTELHAESGDGICLDGFIGKPVISRGNRNYENFFINGRYIKSSILAKAVEDGYQSYMMKHRYPFAVLHFTIPGTSLDINVHPTKLEVRFSDNQKIYEFVLHAVETALAQRELIPQVELGKETERRRMPMPEKKPEVPEPFEEKRRQREQQTGAAPAPISTAPMQTAPASTVPVSTTPAPTAAESRAEEKTSGGDHKTSMEYKMDQMAAQKVMERDFFSEKLLDPKNEKLHRIIGQVFDTYWLVEFKDQLFIIDQHAAHEKVLYERTMKSLEHREYTSQLLNPPVIVTLSMREVQLLKKYLKDFTEIGFEIEEFGGKEYALRAVPDNLFGIAREELFIEMLDSLEGQTEAPHSESIRDRIASMSCKAAVKGNHRLSVSEVHALIDELMTLENPYHCPHGRPTIISMSKYEMEKKFKRIV